MWAKAKKYLVSFGIFLLGLIGLSWWYHSRKIEKDFADLAERTENDITEAKARRENAEMLAGDALSQLEEKSRAEESLTEFLNRHTDSPGPDSPRS